MVGRFQPLTQGHLRGPVEAYGKNGHKTILCMINTPKTKLDDRHPFDSDFLMKEYKKINSELIEDIILVKSANIQEISKQLNKYEIIGWAAGTDRIDRYTDMINRWGEGYVSKDFEMIELKRDDSDISATNMRIALREGNKKFWDKYTINGLKDSFDIFREKILKINNKRMKGIVESIKESYTNIFPSTPQQCSIVRTYNNIFGIANDTHMSVNDEGEFILTGSFLSDEEKTNMFFNGKSYGGIDFKINNTSISPYEFFQLYNIEPIRGVVNNDIVYMFIKSI